MLCAGALDPFGMTVECGASGRCDSLGTLFSQQDAGAALPVSVIVPARGYAFLRSRYIIELRQVGRSTTAG